MQTASPQASGMEVEPHGAPHEEDKSHAPSSLAVLLRLLKDPLCQRSSSTLEFTLQVGVSSFSVFNFCSV